MGKIDYFNSEGNTEKDSRLLEIFLRYALDHVKTLDVVDFELKKRDDLEVFELDSSSLSILKTFDLGDISHYVTTKENFIKRKHFLVDKLKFKDNQFLIVILVLLKEGCWGLPVEFDEDSLSNQININKTNIEREHKKFDEFKRLINFLREEVNHPDYYNLHETPSYFNRFILEKISFSFKDQYNPSNKGVFHFNEIDNNPIINLIFRYMDSMRNRRNEMLRALGLEKVFVKPSIDYVSKPHHLFCYRFTQFVYNNEVLDFKGSRSYRQIYLAYVKLLKEAGFKINTYNDVEGTDLANIKKWFKAGEKILQV